MVLAFSFGTIALHPAVNASLLPASVISVYCAYVCYTGLSSEPRDYFSVIYSALRAGSSTTFLSPPSSPKAVTKKPLLQGDDAEEGKETKEKEARPVSYPYSFFHLIFALASMYSANEIKWIGKIC
ncbi:hypothetical protein J1N35_044734 [Gossypium stocksii]|uniref:Uncharacterized protein n=1 Tax=Gossypium stocksii TaxID=47602 RepID=A0A9D3UA20_9ROSI|nr:hypothetical protein J1N35_044734 [Gossypium stocksii]